MIALNFNLSDCHLEYVKVRRDVCHAQIITFVSLDRLFEYNLTSQVSSMDDPCFSSKALGDQWPSMGERHYDVSNALQIPGDRAGRVRGGSTRAEKGHRTRVCHENT